MTYYKKGLAAMVGQIRLADGSSWGIIAGDQQTTSLIACFKEAMQLRSIQESDRQLIVLRENNRANSTVSDGVNKIALMSFESEDTVVCSLIPADSGMAFVLQLWQLSLIISLHTQSRGGVLLHGALAEWQGNGVILAGKSGIGKTTASQRLVPPWRSLCDDLTLVVRDAQGKYWAHPWPTWSRFMSGRPESGGTWDVHHAVPLKGIFFLTQAREMQLEPIGPGKAVCLLVRSWDQAQLGMPCDVNEDRMKLLCLQGFNNICALVQGVSCYILHLSLTDAFWQEIETVIIED